ncbi:siderophore-interacting protein [Streptomyces sp. NBC_00344]|uniref:siderophore-interacting protein n=1 Tax=Streptomyces sp. NBC_00344 TaxID=2975720 RepID=UPI002E1AD9A1
MTTVATAPFRFFGLHVVRTRRLGPSMVRITFGGEDLRDFAAGGRDQSLSLFLPHPGQQRPVLPAGDDWFTEWRALPESVRAVMRSYTVRGQRRDPDEIDIDFALHDDLGEGAGRPGHGGPAGRWARQATPGQQVTALGPAVARNKAVRFQPPTGTDSVLICADETALPAAAATLEWLPAGTRAHVWLDVRHSLDRQPLFTEADARITWLVRAEGAPRAVDAVRAAALPGASPYAWIAGEAGGVRELRRHLVHERGLDRRHVTFVGYWRHGLSEEQLRETAA